MILVDTNIFIEYYKNNSLICKILGHIDPQEIAISDVVCAELYFGARNKQEAATALFHNAELFTLNRKDFACIPNLKLYEHK